jgi:hypothetical protein
LKEVPGEMLIITGSTHQIGRTVVVAMSVDKGFVPAIRPIGITNNTSYEGQNGRCPTSRKGFRPIYSECKMHRCVSDEDTALCKVLRYKISEVEVIESILRILSFVLGSIETIDAATWAPLFECFGASDPCSFVDKLGVLNLAHPALKSIAGHIIVSVLSSGRFIVLSI